MQMLGIMLLGVELPVLEQVSPAPDMGRQCRNSILQRLVD